MGTLAEFVEFVSHVRTHMWTPVIDSIYPLERVDAAYKRLQSPQRMGKVVLTIPPCITPDMEEDLR